MYIWNASFDYLIMHLHMLMSFYDVKSRLKCNFFVHVAKFFIFVWMGVIISNAFNIFQCSI